MSMVDIKYDVFELKPIGNNGVCLTGSDEDCGFGNIDQAYKKDTVYKLYSII